MGHEGSTAQHQLMGLGPATREDRRGLAAAVVRAALALVWVLIGINGFTEARDASVGDLRQDLASGSVNQIEVQRPGPGDQAQGTFGLRWDAGLFDSFTRYEYRSDAGVDEVAELLEQARADSVPVHVVPTGQYPPYDMVTSNGWLVTTLGTWAVAAGLLVAMAGWIMLITSGPPWLATKWAWFWLLWAIPLLWPVFFLLEPRPLRMSLRLARSGRAPQPLLRDQDRRLTGGWALIIAWIASALLATTGVPVLSAWH